MFWDVALEAPGLHVGTMGQAGMTPACDLSWVHMHLVVLTQSALRTHFWTFDTYLVTQLHLVQCGAVQFDACAQQY